MRFFLFSRKNVIYSSNKQSILLIKSKTTLKTLKTSNKLFGRYTRAFIGIKTNILNYLKSPRSNHLLRQYNEIRVRISN